MGSTSEQESLLQDWAEPSGRGPNELSSAEFLKASSAGDAEHGKTTFKGYAENIEAKSGKTLEYFWKLASRKGFVKRGHVVAKHGEMLAWLKSEMRLGHVHANFIILFLRLRVNDQKVSSQAREWAFHTGFRNQNRP